MRNDTGATSRRASFDRSRPGYHNMSSSRLPRNSAFKEVVVEVPKNACGLIVGKKGRNIKELQRVEGIRFINVNFNDSTVKIVGMEDDIIAAQRRIDLSVAIATNILFP